MKIIWGGMALILLAGCAANRAEFSAANDGRLTAGGAGAAYYTVRTAPNDWGEINVRLSPPALRSAGTNPSSPRIVDFEVTINNNSTEPVSFNLSRAHLDLADDSGKSVLGVKPEPVDPVNVGASEDRSFRLSFTVPASSNPKNIASFELFWALAQNGKGYSQSTLFQRDEGVYYYAPYDPFWSPYWDRLSWPRRSGLSLGVGVSRTF